MSNRRKVSTTIYLDEDQVADLKRICQKLDVPQASLVRKGIDLAIDWGEERIAIWDKAEELVTGIPTKE